MAGEKKDFNTLSDAEIDALSPEDLLEYQHGEVRDDDGGGGEGGAGDGGKPPVEGDDEIDLNPDIEVPEGKALVVDDDGKAILKDGKPEFVDYVPEDEGEGGETEAERLARVAAEEEGGDTVPHARFNEVNEEAKDLRLLVRTLLAERTPAAAKADEVPAPTRPEFDFKAKQREYHKFVTEGEDEKAIAVLDEIEDARAAIHKFDIEDARASARQEAVGDVTATRTAEQVREVENTLYRAFPFLNNKSKDADEAAILAVNAKAKQLIAAGKPVALALAEAGESIGKRFAKLIAPKNVVRLGVDGKPLKAAPDTRTPAAIRRNLDVRQPATQKSGVGNREQVATLDITEMTDEQLDRLEKEDPAAFAALRGDDRIG